MMLKKDKIKKFIDIYIPTELCNLRCHYCYITQQRKFNNVIAKFSHSPEMIRKALSKKRLGGACLLNFCAGGETLLSSEVLPIVKQLLLEGHYIMIVTNGTITNRFEELTTWDKSILNRLFFKFSFHYLELKRLNKVDVFFANVNLVKKIGASFTIEITPSDELMPYIEEIKQVCLKNVGALCHVTIGRDAKDKNISVLSNYSFEDYKNIWNKFNSELFDFKTQLYKEKREEFCYAGEWSAYLNLETGRLKQCYCGETIDNIYENISRPIHFKPIGYNCSLPYCYNGHAFLALGDIPEINSVSFADERNRKCLDGSEWLTPEMKTFMSSKLYETNKEYSQNKKANINKKKKGGFISMIRNFIRKNSKK